MKYDILFTDMDGTLLNEEKSISKEVLTAMSEYTRHGGQIVLSSGRPLESIVQVAKTLNLITPNMYIISFNGALIYDLSNDKVICEKRVPLPLVRKILDTAHEMNVHCHTYSDTNIISEFDTPELHKYTVHVKIPYLIKENATDYLASLNQQPLKLLAMTMEDRKPLYAFANKLHEVVGDEIHTFFSQMCYLECCMKDASKGNAVRFLCDYLNIPIERSVAVGDAANDISMLEAAGFSYAMFNATDDVKRVASYITKRGNAHDGILEVFEAMY